MSTATTADDEAYRRLVEPYRRELHAHCYRMLGSVHDADDALQDALLRAWRALPRFEGRSVPRSSKRGSALQARTSVSCTASSASCTDPSIR